MKKRILYFSLFDKPGFLLGNYAGPNKAVVEKAVMAKFEVDTMEGFTLKQVPKRSGFSDEFRVIEE